MACSPTASDAPVTVSVNVVAVTADAARVPGVGAVVSPGADPVKLNDQLDVPDRV